MIDLVGNGVPSNWATGIQMLKPLWAAEVAVSAVGGLLLRRQMSRAKHIVAKLKVRIVVGIKYLIKRIGDNFDDGLTTWTHCEDPIR